MGLQQQFINHFVERAGYKEVDSRSRKYRMLVKGDAVLWIGKKGAVRTGRTVSESMPIMPRVLEAIKKTMKEGK